MTYPNAGASPSKSTSSGTGTGEALRVALAYHQAWAAGDFEQAMTFISPEIVCAAPAGTLTGAEAFRGFMGPFVGMLTSSTVLAAFGDDDTALLIYDAATVLVADAPGAEWHTVAEGRIVAMRIIFDRLPFVEARRSGPASR